MENRIEGKMSDFVVKSRMRGRIIEAWLSDKLSTEVFERILKGEVIEICTCKGDGCECQKRKKNPK